MKRLSLWRLTVSLLVTIVLLIILIRQITIDDLLSTFDLVALSTILIGFIVYLGVVAMRSARYWFMLDRKLKFFSVFKITVYQTFFNIILPFHAGDLSFIYLVRKSAKASGTEALTIYGFTRIFDLVILSLFYLLASFGYIGLVVQLQPLILISAAVAGLMIVVVIILFVSGDKVLILFKAFAVWTGLAKIKITQLGLQRADKITKALAQVRKPTVFLPGLLCTIGIWSLLYLLAFIMVSAMGLNLGIIEVILGNTFFELSSVVPFYFFGGYGVAEGAWTIAFVLLGVEKSLAISSGFIYHTILNMYIFIIGFIILILQYLIKSFTSLVER